MRLSIERLTAESAATGFRPEMLEKVIHLLGLLEGFTRHPLSQEPNRPQGRYCAEPVRV